MEHKKLLVLLAIFCIISSAAVACVCATDADYAESNHQDMNGIDGNQYDHAIIGDENSTAPAEDAGLSPENQTNPLIGNETGNATDNATAHEAGNTTGADIQNATGNATPTTNGMPSTGNPIIALLAVSALIGSYAVIKRE